MSNKGENECKTKSAGNFSRQHTPRNNEQDNKRKAVLPSKLVMFKPILVSSTRHNHKRKTPEQAPASEVVNLCVWPGNLTR
ncbi:hypothetical protein O4H62_07700 [Hoeflea alexandrii]|nr:hypothetical protein [Hoeflea alexandrii]